MPTLYELDDLFIIIGLDLPAFDKAIATACFCGLPSLTIIRMLEDTALSDLPDFNGIMNHLFV